MGDKTLIEWLGDPFLNIAGATWNRYWGCRRVSAECDFCYIDLTIGYLRQKREETRRLTTSAGPALLGMPAFPSSRSDAP